MEKQYQIITNAHGRRILVIHDMTNVELREDITHDNFDALFFHVEHMSPVELRFALLHTSPFESEKCWIKPRFSVPMGEHFMPGLEYLLDGQAESPTDAIITQRIEEIYQRIGQLGIHHKPNTHRYHVHQCLRLCNYCLARGFNEMTATIAPTMSKGFPLLFNTLFYNKSMHKRDTLFKFLQKLRAVGYIERLQHVDRIHLCPKCHSNHLLFIESCPKCQSSNIKQSSVIHHFRCANVSPEDTYTSEGQLRCPKCRQQLRHIGVDYDRPADLFNCHQCGTVFLNPAMRVVCASCGQTHTPQQLMPHDIHVYRFTPLAMDEIPSMKAVNKFSHDIWNGFTSFEEFVSQVRWLAGTPNSAVVTFRFGLSQPGLSPEAMTTFTSELHIRCYRFNLTWRDHQFYLSHRCTQGTEVSQAKADMALELATSVNQLLARHAPGISYQGRQVYVYQSGEDVEAFIRELTAFTPPPHELKAKDSTPYNGQSNPRLSLLPHRRCGGLLHAQPARRCRAGHLLVSLLR